MWPSAANIVSEASVCFFVEFFLIHCALAPALATKLRRWSTKLAGLGSASLMRLA